MDTRASLTVISEQAFQEKLKSTPKIQPSNAYTGEELEWLKWCKTRAAV